MRDANSKLSGPLLMVMAFAFLLLCELIVQWN